MSRAITSGMIGAALLALPIAGSVRAARAEPILLREWTAQGGSAGALLGISVASAGDVDGDGFDDVIVGAYEYTGAFAAQGQARLYRGSANGLATNAAWTVEGDTAFAFLGRSVAGAGDVNGDGYGDVVVGALGASNGEAVEGIAYVFLGSADGLGASPAWSFEGNQTQAQLGFSVAGAGDVNGDGFDDVIVGAYRYDAGQMNEGRALLFTGSAEGLSAQPAWKAQGNQGSAWFGYSVAGAGDVNADGFDDVIVGAFLFDGEEIDEGRAFVYLGSAGGLETSPAWISEGDQPAAFHGRSVAGRADVDGDGFDDVIVGSPNWEGAVALEGRAVVYLGSPSGPSATPSWTIAGGQAGATLGRSVASAGDVDADGFGDVVLGAHQFDGGEWQEGRALVVLGSAQGLALEPAWSDEANQAEAFFGISVACAGDVDADGRDDVVVGAYRYDVDAADEGLVALYTGSGLPVDVPPGGRDAAVPQLFLAAYPNPFVGSSTLAFTLPEERNVTLVLYDAAGRRVRTLVDGAVRAGASESAWDGRDESGRAVAAGVYFARLEAGTARQTRRVTLVR